jgi:nucleotide-binding universal stress UspA family protein
MIPSHKEHTMSSTEPYRIVVAYDFSDSARLALEEALRMALHNAPAELHLATVLDSDHAAMIPSAQRHSSLVQIADNLRERLGCAGRDALAGIQAKQRGFVLPTLAHVRIGPIAEQIAALAAEIEAQVVVLGTHGRKGLPRLLLGSVAEKIVRLAPCPVLVVRPRDFSRLPAGPALEPACPDCVAARTATQGATWWCEAHLRAPEPAHIYSRSHRLDHAVIAGDIQLSG